MHDEERAAQFRDLRRQVLFLGVEQELALDGERPAGERYPGFALRRAGASHDARRSARQW
jgi:hypothetical protein